MSLLALSRHPLVHRQCLLLAVKRAWLTHGKMFAYDPKRDNETLEPNFGPTAKRLAHLI